MGFYAAGQPYLNRFSISRGLSMATSATDPFETLYGQVSTTLAELQQANGAPGATLSDSARSEFQKELDSLQWDVQDLRETVSIAGEDPARFGLSSSEVKRRSRLLDELENRVRVCESLAVSTPRAAGADNSNSQGEMQMAIIQQQDEELDQLAVAVNKIGEMGKGINEELEEQGHLLDELDDDFSNTRVRMGDVHSRLNDFIQETGRGQLCTIVGLIALFFVLLFLLVTT